MQELIATIETQAIIIAQRKTEVGTLTAKLDEARKDIETMKARIAELEKANG